MKLQRFSVKTIILLLFCILGSILMDAQVEGLVISRIRNQNMDQKAPGSPPARRSIISASMNGCWGSPSSSPRGHARGSLTTAFLAADGTENDAVDDDESSSTTSPTRSKDVAEPTKTTTSYSLSYGVGYALGPVAAASVLIWTGVWDLQDHFLFPDNGIYSGLACVGIAIPLTILVHIMSRRENHSDEDIPYVFLISLCGIEYWRGVWLLWESCVFPSNRPLQSLLAIIFGVLVLMATGKFSAQVAGPSVMFPDDTTEETADWDGGGTVLNGDYTSELQLEEIPNRSPTEMEDTEFEMTTLKQLKETENGSR